MQHGICTLSVIPARREPSGTAEMVTQLLFGEPYRVLEAQDEWLRIKTAFDHYECWISRKQHTRITDQTYQQIQKSNVTLNAGMVNELKELNSGAAFPVTMGCILPAFNHGEARIESATYRFNGETTDMSVKKGPAQIVATAKQLLNAPYLWGGKTPFGIDCSGFTQLVYRINGYSLPRDSNQQVEHGTALSFVEEAETGDLAFFDNADGKIVHVGILLNHREIIHSSGFVKIEKFDHYGIYNAGNKGYSHTLRVIKRLIT